MTALFDAAVPAESRFSFPESIGDAPFSVTVECPSHPWPFSASVVLRNDDDEQPWIVSLAVVSAELLPLPPDLAPHVRVTPYSPQSGSTLLLAPGLAQRITLFFDPFDEDSLRALRGSQLLLRWTRSGQAAPGFSVYTLGFSDWDVLDDSGFRLDREGYRFENVRECYGMCATAALYHTGELARPEGAACTFALPRESASPLVRQYQSCPANSLGTMAARLQDDILEPADLVWLRRQLRAGVPVVAWFVQSRLGDAHAVLIRAMLQHSARDIGVLAVYDPDHSFTSPHGFNPEAFGIVHCDTASGRILHGGYSGFAFGRPQTIRSEK